MRRLLKRLALGALILSAGWLVYTLARIRILVRNSERIAAQSATFPRDYFIGDKNKPLLTYLAMGDSTAAGWGAERLEGTYPYKFATAVAKRGHRVHVINVAVGGAKVEDVCRVQIPALAKVRPDLITLTVGANDVTHRTTDGDCIRGFRTLFTALHRSTARAIIAANIPDMYQVPALPRPASTIADKYTRRLNVLLYGEAQSQGIPVLDLWGHGKLIYSKNPSLYASDLFHPSAKGYAIWAQLFIKALPNDI